MNERVTPPIQALPDGEAEIALVIRLPWEDVARLGQDATRLATQTGRPVTLDEAVGHRLRSTRAAAAHAKPAAQQPPAAVTSTASVSSLPSRPPAEQARQASERINGVGQHDTA